jgi:hypothetical protein
MKKNNSLNFLRIVALILLVVGMIGSLSLVLYKGRNNQSVLLIALFVIWVLSPFFAILVAHKVSKIWSDQFRKALYVLMLILSIGSLLGYSGIFSSPSTKPAFVFLVIPLISWIILAIVLPITRKFSKDSKPELS